MSFFDQPFVADKAEANTGGVYEPLKEGDYALIIEKAELTKSKKDKEMMKLTLKVESGEHENRTFFHNFNLENDNPVAVEIAKKQLHALLIMIGLRSFSHPDDLIGHSFQAHVKVTSYVDPGSGQKRYNNEAVFAIKKDAEVAATNAVPAAATTTAPRPSATASKW